MLTSFGELLVSIPIILSIPIMFILIDKYLPDDHLVHSSTESQGSKEE